MKVAELINLLRAQPPERRVVLRGYEEGYADISGLRERAIKLNALMGRRKCRRGRTAR